MNFNPNMPMQPNMNRPFQQGPINNAMSGGQAYNPGNPGRVLQQTPMMHPATKPPMPPMVQVPMQNMMPPPNMFAQKAPPPVMQNAPMQNVQETKANIESPIDINKIGNFSQYLRNLRSTPMQQNYPDINVFGTYF